MDPEIEIEIEREEGDKYDVVKMVCDACFAKELKFVRFQEQSLISI